MSCLTKNGDQNLNDIEVPITVLNKYISIQDPLSPGVAELFKGIIRIIFQRPILKFGISGLILVLMGLGAAFKVFSEGYLPTKFLFILSKESAVFLIMGLLISGADLFLNTIVAVVMENSRKTNKFWVQL